MLRHIKADVDTFKTIIQFVKITIEVHEYLRIISVNDFFKFHFLNVDISVTI